jgi:hypothetical protein
MKPKGLIAILGLLLVAEPASTIAGMETIPGKGDKENEPLCFTETQVENGINDAIEHGRQVGIAQCQAEPSNCGITPRSVVPWGDYGETEPNDNIVTADPMIEGVYYSGQCYREDDHDHYYLTSVEPNQKLTVNFFVPDFASEGASRDASWTITVSDAAGNVLAKWNTDLMASNEISLPTMLPYASTYYLSVARTPDQYSAMLYQISYVLEFTEQDGVQPVDVNFFDTELEPNDTPGLANPIATTVTMYGVVNVTFDTPVVALDDPLEATWGQGESDWFFYNSGGDEIVQLSLCARERCRDGNWLLEVYDQANAAIADTPEAKPLIAMNTQFKVPFDAQTLGVGIELDEEPNVVKFGLAQPGTYYLRVTQKRRLEAPCVASHTEFQCTQVDRRCLTAGKDEEGNSTTETSEACSIDGPMCEGGDPPRNGPCWLDSCGSWGDVEICDAYGGVVEIGPGDTTSQYHFQWHATKLSPLTADSEAHEIFEQRPNHFDR